MIDYILYISVSVTAFLLRLVPLRLAVLFGKFIGRTGFYTNPKYKRIAYMNLKAAFSHELPPHKIRKITSKTFENMGMVAAELLCFPKLDERYVDRFIDIKNSDLLKNVLSTGKPVIFLSAHFGNWELAGLLMSIKGFRQKIIAKRQTMSKMNSLLNKYRQLYGNKVVVVSEGMASKEFIKGIKEHFIVTSLIDQGSDKEGLFLDFFGRLASTAVGALKVAQKFNAILISGFLARQDLTKHVFDIGPSFEFINSDEESLKKAAQLFTAKLQFQIREYPHQWLWFQKRWKETPQRTILVLNDGKTGHLNQSIAVAEILKGAYEDRYKDIIERLNLNDAIRIKVININFRTNLHKALQSLCGIFSTHSCQGCLRCLKFSLSENSFKELSSTFADFVISCGSRLSSVNRIISCENSAKSIHIMKPTILSTNRFTLVIVPRHDRLTKKRNIVTTYGAITRIQKDALTAQTLKFQARLKELNIAIDRNNGPVFSAFIGGDTSRYKISKEIVEEFVDKLIEASNSLNASLLISTSRRTPGDIEYLLEQKLKDFDRCKLLIIANKSNIEGVVNGMIGLSDFVIVSADSISMISEAASSGRHTLVFLPTEEKRLKQRHKIFLHNLSKEGFITMITSRNLNDVIENLRDKPYAKILNDRETIKRAVEGII